MTEILTSQPAPLLPCPFCGAEPRVSVAMDESIWNHKAVPWTTIRCDSCDANSGAVCEGDSPTAHERWNSRAGFPVTDATKNQAPEGGELPPLPSPVWPSGFYGQIGAGAYTAEQMRAYARAALAAQPEDDAPYANAAFERGYQHGRQQERQLQEARKALAPAEGDGLAAAAAALVQAVQRDWPSTPSHRTAVLAAADKVQSALASKVQPKGTVREPVYADPLTQAIQRLNSNVYNLTKDECIQVIRELRDELRAAPDETLLKAVADRLHAPGHLTRDQAEKHAAAVLETIATRAAEPDLCQNCGDMPHPGCNSEFSAEPACRFWGPGVQAPTPASGTVPVSVLEAIFATLKRANTDGSICDTIWHGTAETLFDFIEVAIEQAAPAVPCAALAQQETYTPYWQGGLSNAELAQWWRLKTKAEPTDRDMSCFALGVEVGCGKKPAPKPQDLDRAIASPAPAPEALHRAARKALEAWSKDVGSDETILTMKALYAALQAPAVKAETQCKNCGGKGYADAWTMDGEYNPSVCEECDAYAKYRAAQEARRDAARLDFIEADHRLELKNNSEMIERGFTTPRWSVDIPLPFDRGYENVGKGDTLRAAIDAAMKSKPPVQGTGGQS